MELRAKRVMHNRVRSASGSPFCQARRAAGPVPGMDRSVSVIFSPRRHRLTPRLFKRNLSQMTSKIRTFCRTCDRFEEILPSPLPVAQSCILSLLFGCRTATKKPPEGGFSSGICPSFLDGGKQEVSYAGRPLPQVSGPKSQKPRGACRCLWPARTTALRPGRSLPASPAADGANNRPPTRTPGAGRHNPRSCGPVPGGR